MQIKSMRTALCTAAVATLSSAIAVQVNAYGTDPCPGDVNGDGGVNVADLLVVLNNWDCEKDCQGDVNGDGSVNVADLILVIQNFGPCEGEGCQTPADCDDGDPCTFDLCIQGTCHHFPIPGCE